MYNILQTGVPEPSYTSYTNQCANIASIIKEPNVYKWLTTQLPTTQVEVIRYM